MQSGILSQPCDKTAQPSLKTVNNKLFTKMRHRMPCPRCIGGNMFREHDEYICIQCGNSYYPDTGNKLTATVKLSSGRS